MIITYKIITGKVNLDREDFFSFSPKQTDRGSHQYKVKKPKAVKKVRRNAFSIRVVNEWNKLPKDVVTAQSTTEFKRKLDEFWGQEEECTTPF